ncbi:MAG: DUF2784 family protein [Desulfobacterales bacterium]
MLYRAAADAILVLHTTFIAFVVLGLGVTILGGVLGWRWVRSPWFRLTHLAAIGYVVMQAWLGVVCPLTIWESELRILAGEDPYDPQGFIATWLQRLIFFQAEPWPCFTLSADLPFAAGCWGAVRAHHLFPKSREAILEEIFSHENTVNWIENRLNWEISDYPEFWGSLHLVLPNPLYRSLRMKLIPGQNESDSVHVLFRPRKNKSVAGLKLYHAERRSMGLTGGQDVTVEESDFVLSHTGKTEQCATIVRCPSRGLLDIQPFTGFVRQIGLNMSMTATRRTVITSQDAVTAVEANVRSHDASQTIGDPLPGELEWGRLLTRQIHAREERKRAESLGQRWLDQPDEARALIQGILAGARSRIIIVDPYFAGHEMVDFVLTRVPQDVEITILTGAVCLKEKTPCQPRQDQAGGQREKGYELNDLLSQAVDQNFNICAMVMTGANPAIHDRFLVVDDQVWFSGNSLNNIGQRASMLTRLHDPQSIISKLEEVICGQRVKPLDEFQAGRQ